MTTYPDDHGLPPVPAYDCPPRFRPGALARRRLVRLADVVLHVVALAIIGIMLVGLVGSGRSDAHFGSSTHSAAMQARNFAQALDAVRRRTDALPERLDALVAEDPITKEPYMEPVPDDPWGTPYRYVVRDARRGRFEVRSAGPDRAFDTDDDVVFER